MEEYYDILARCPLFFGISEADMQTMLHCLAAGVRTYAKHEFVLRAGDAARSMGIVISGGVHIVQEDYWGNRTILAHMPPGALFGEAFSCAEVSSLPVGAQCVEETQVLLIDGRRLMTTCSSACAHHAKLVKNMMALLAQKNIQLTRKMEIVTQRTTRARLLAYLSEQAVRAGESRFVIPFDRRQLADFLSVERSAMSTELSKMQAEGLIWTKKSEFDMNPKAQD